MYACSLRNSWLPSGRGPQRATRRQASPQTTRIPRRPRQSRNPAHHRADIRTRRRGMTRRTTRPPECRPFRASARPQRRGLRLVNGERPERGRGRRVPPPIEPGERPWWLSSVDNSGRLKPSVMSTQAAHKPAPGFRRWLLGLWRGVIRYRVGVTVDHGNVCGTDQLDQGRSAYFGLGPGGDQLRHMGQHCGEAGQHGDDKCQRDDSSGTYTRIQMCDRAGAR